MYCQTRGPLKLQLVSSEDGCMDCILTGPLSLCAFDFFKTLLEFLRFSSSISAEWNYFSFLWRLFAAFIINIRKVWECFSTGLEDFLPVVGCENKLTTLVLPAAEPLAHMGNILSLHCPTAPITWDFSCVNQKLISVHWGITSVFSPVHPLSPTFGKSFCLLVFKTMLTCVVFLGNFANSS